MRALSARQIDKYYDWFQFFNELYNDALSNTEVFTHIVRDQIFKDTFFCNFIYRQPVFERQKMFWKLIIKGRSDNFINQSFLRDYKKLSLFLNMSLAMIRSKQNQLLHFFQSQELFTEIEEQQVGLMRYERLHRKAKAVQRQIESFMPSARDVANVAEIYMNFDFQSPSMYEVYFLLDDNNHNNNRNELYLKNFLLYAATFQQIHYSFKTLIRAKIESQIFAKRKQSAGQFESGNAKSGQGIQIEAPGAIEEYESSDEEPAEADNELQIEADADSAEKKFEIFTSNWYKDKLVELEKEVSYNFGKHSMSKRHRMDPSDKSILGRNSSLKLSMHLLRSDKHFLLDMLKKLCAYIKFTQWQIEHRYINLGLVKDIPSVYDCIRPLKEGQFRSVLDFYRVGVMSRVLFFELLDQYFGLELWKRLRAKSKYAKYIRKLASVFGVAPGEEEWESRIHMFAKKEVKVINDYVFLLTVFYGFENTLATEKERKGFLSKDLKRLLREEKLAKKENFLKISMTSNSKEESENSKFASYQKEAFHLIVQLKKCKQIARDLRKSVSLRDWQWEPTRSFEFRLSDLLSMKSLLIQPSVLKKHHIEDMAEIDRNYKQSKRRLRVRVIEMIFKKFFVDLQAKNMLFPKCHKPMTCFCQNFLCEMVLKQYFQMDSRLEIKYVSGATELINSRHEKCKICGIESATTKFAQRKLTLQVKNDENKGQQARLARNQSAKSKKSEVKVIQLGTLGQDFKDSKYSLDYFQRYFFSYTTSIFDYVISFDESNNEIKLAKQRK